MHENAINRLEAFQNTIIGPNTGEMPGGIQIRDTERILLYVESL